MIYGNENAIRSNPSAVKRHHLTIRESWWKTLEDGFVENFLIRTKRLGDIVKFNDHEYQMTETDRIRSRLQGIVSSILPHGAPHASILGNVLNSASLITKSSTSDGLHQVDSYYKTRSRKNSVTSLAESFTATKTHLRDSTDTGIFSASNYNSALNSESSLTSAESAVKLNRRHSSIFELTHAFTKKLSPLKNMSPLKTSALEEANIYLLFNFISLEKISEIWGPILFSSFSWQSGYKQKSVDLFKWMLENSEEICSRESRLSVQSMPAISNQPDQDPKQSPQRHSWDAATEKNFGTSPKAKRSSYRVSLDSIYEDMQPLDDKDFVSSRNVTPIPRFNSKTPYYLTVKTESRKIPRKPVPQQSFQSENDNEIDILELYEERKVYE
jgi:hypothetical protein